LEDNIVIMEVEMENFITSIPTWIITLFIGLLGIAVGWGYFKSEVKHLDQSQKNQDNKIDTLEKNIQLRSDCRDYRERCQENIKIQIGEIKLAIDKNREAVLDRFDEVKEFMGYVKGKIEDYNGRLK
jgi:gas vesicle protein